MEWNILNKIKGEQTYIARADSEVKKMRECEFSMTKFVRKMS